MTQSQIKARKILQMMASKDFDLDEYAASESFQGICRLLEHNAVYPDENCKEVLDYWQQRSLRKELHQAEDPGNKWASFLPLGIQPDDNAGRRYPLLFILHGAGNPIYLAECYGYTEIAAREQMIAIIPENESSESIEKLLDYCKIHYPVDWSRVYMVGYSLGGMMTTRHALCWPELFAAVGCGGMLFANGAIDTYWHHDIPWRGEAITERILAHAQRVKIPACICMGEQEFIELLPVTREPTPPLQAAPSIDAQGHPVPTLDLSSGNKIASVNNWRRVAGCSCIPEQQVRAAVESSQDIVTQKLGFPFERTSVVQREGRRHFVGDCINPQGELLTRFIGLERSAHWPSAALAELTWEFLRQFARDPDTKESYRIV